MDKEYHPIIEEYIVDYVDEKLTATERERHFRWGVGFW